MLINGCYNRGVDAVEGFRNWNHSYVDDAFDLELIEDVYERSLNLVDGRGKVFSG